MRLLARTSTSDTHPRLLHRFFPSLCNLIIATSSTLTAPLLFPSIPFLGPWEISQHLFFVHGPVLDPNHVLAT